MPKMKTRKAIAAKVRVTGTGKLLRSRACKRHLLTNKSAKRKRQLSKAGLVSEAHLKLYKRLIQA